MRSFPISVLIAESKIYMWIMKGERTFGLTEWTRMRLNNFFFPTKFHRGERKKGHVLQLSRSKSFSLRLVLLYFAVEKRKKKWPQNLFIHLWRRMIMCTAVRLIFVRTKSALLSGLKKSNMTKEPPTTVSTQLERIWRLIGAWFML